MPSRLCQALLHGCFTRMLLLAQERVDHHLDERLLFSAQLADLGRQQAWRSFGVVEIFDRNLEMLGKLLDVFPRIGVIPLPLPDELLCHAHLVGELL